MSATDKLTALNQRSEDLKRELADLAAVRPHSANAALADLESALMRELEKIETQVRRIQNYIGQCGASSPAEE